MRRHSLGIHDLYRTHSLVSLQWSGLSQWQTLLLTENVVSTSICDTKMRSSANRALITVSLPRQLPCVWHVVAIPTYLPLSYLFASAKPIFTTDCTN